jgi:hypothetical protein
VRGSDWGCENRRKIDRDTFAFSHGLCVTDFVTSFFIGLCGLNVVIHATNFEPMKAHILACAHCMGFMYSHSE